MEETDIKICPECGAEFYAHAESCSDCGVPLVWKKDNPWEPPEPKPAFATALRDGVVIRTGDQGLMLDLSDILKEKGLFSEVRPVDESKGGGILSGGPMPKHNLSVEKDNVDNAIQVIEAHYRELHPELEQADRWAAENRCPACGHPIGADASECEDCGLILPVEDEQ